MNDVIFQIKKSLFIRMKEYVQINELTFSEGLRLHNGYTEGINHLVTELFGSTLVIFPPEKFIRSDILAIDEFYRDNIPAIQSTIVKPRSRNGKSILFSGANPAKKILENKISYSIDLLHHQDTTFYLDTRNLRTWLQDNMKGLNVLNTFAYTGSLGLAAYYGGAKSVTQNDLNTSYLQIAENSYNLNNLPFNKADFIQGDFFEVIANFKKQGRLFDCIILDPPYFSQTSKGKFNLNTDYLRLVNKVRPLIANNGLLICVNNALFVSGDVFLHELETICEEGFAKIYQIINCHMDITGGDNGSLAKLPANPAPFNYSTKIVILQFTRKDKRST